MPCQPVGERCQPPGLSSIDPPSAIERCIDEPGGLKELQMLHNCCARNRQTSRELASGHRRTRKALKNNHPDRVSKQREYPHDCPEGCRVCV
jgi:hypothetical protein